jgi:hypothetical protein
VPDAAFETAFTAGLAALAVAGGRGRLFAAVLVSFDRGADREQQASAVAGKNAKDAKTDLLRNARAIDGDEAKLMAGLSGVSNWRGGHAGLTDPAEAPFGLHMTTATARYLLAADSPPRLKRQPRRR